MVIGTHKPKPGDNDNWSDALAIVLDEMMTSLAECVHGLTDDQLRATPIAGRHSILTMVMHTLGTIDDFCVGFQTGQRLLTDQPWFDMWSRSAEQVKALQSGADLPTAAELAATIARVEAAAKDALASASEADLRTDRAAKGALEQRGWSAARMYMRAFGHAAAHVRQVWALRGAMGCAGATDAAWPQQHYV